MEVFTSYTHLKNQDSDREIVIVKVNLSDKIEVMIGLLPSFVSRKCSIENSNWTSNKKKDEIIQLDILIRPFCNTIKIRKNQELAYILLINQKCYEKLVTAYNIYNLD